MELNLQPQAVSGYLTLELVREEPVITARECGGRDVRPASERKACLEERVHWLLRVRQQRKHVGCQVMKEIGRRIEACIGIAPVAKIIAPHSVGLAGISPPFAGGLSGYWDHGVQQHEF